MRLVLVLLLVHGLAPGLSEVAEAFVHYAWTGHAAHTAADRGDLGDQGPEHGCGTTQHRCTCCATQVVVPSATAGVPRSELSPTTPVVRAGPTLAARAPARPFRPPIS